ncbi:hypothetical protein IX51_03495 [uncultured archaeon]|nr:hypothetical protein IX51_03495 [uncultured archaeon]
MPVEEGLRQKLAMANRIIVNENLTELGRGHVAYKLEEGKILIPGHLHDFQRSIADCTASDIVTIDYDGNVLEGSYPESMHEFYFYSEVFQVRRDVKAALHMHSFYANLLEITDSKLQMSTRDSFLFIDGLPVFDGLPLFVNTKEMGYRMAQALGKSKAVLHRGHGAFVVGESIEDVVITAASLERAAKKQYMASALGSIVEYDHDRVRRTDTKDIREEVSGIDWGYFVTRLEKKGTVY